MFSKVISIIWVIVGIIWLIRPSALQLTLRKKSYKQVRGLLFSISFLIGGYLILLAVKLQGIYSKILVILGLIVLAKGLFFVKSKASEKLFDALGKVPIYVFRIFAGIFTLLGVSLYFLK